MTQCEMVLQYMSDRGGISSRDAFMDLGIVSLPRRICDLKNQGHIITDVTLTAENRHGKPVRFKYYSLADDE